MSDAAKRPKRLTVSVPCGLAEEIDAERKRDDRKFGPELVRLAREGLRAREKARRERREGAEER